MSINYNPERSTEPEHVNHVLRFVGGSTAVTKVYGNGMTVAYTTTGQVTITWAENPGNFVGAQFTFLATTASGVKGWTATCPAGPTKQTNGTYTLIVSLWNSTFAAADLAALQWLSAVFFFKTTAV